MNGDGVTGNDLMYIPRYATDLVFAPRTFFAGTSDQFVYTAAQQAADFDAYINADPYLRAHRGEYAERNGAVQPWQHRVDFRLLQDIFTNLGDNKNSLQFSLDIFNVGNLINRNWGVYQFQYTSSPLAFQSYNAQGQPTYQFQYVSVPTRTVNGGTATVNPGTVLTTPFRNDVTTLASRWQAQIGLRYLFN
ncbi:hypothetical protein I3A86_24765 [Salmonella enterica]|nr:hypothetical protein [Salmonella enterica]